MRTVNFKGLEDVQGAKAVKARRFVQQYLEEHSFPYYSPLTVEIAIYPGFGWGHLYGVHAVLHDNPYYKGDGLHRDLNKSIAEALNHIARQMHYGKPIFPGEAVL